MGDRLWCRDNETRHIGDITNSEESTLDAGNRALFEKPSEEPEKNWCTGKYQQVKIAYAIEFQRMYCRRATQHKEYVEDIASYYISKCNAGLSFQRCGDRGRQFR